jgi:broad specificity polyphosphatase/5'/3'-nucleotidase SurE
MTIMTAAAASCHQCPVGGVKQGVISGITAAAVSEVAHGGENNASEFTTTEQLALQGLVVIAPWV